MNQIRTGVYKTKIIKRREEFRISKERLEKNLMNFEQTINNRKNIPQYKSNVERLERIIKTGTMLLEGYKFHEIAQKLDLKDSTIFNYIINLNYPKQENLHTVSPHKNSN